MQIPTIKVDLITRNCDKQSQHYAAKVAELAKSSGVGSAVSIKRTPFIKLLPTRVKLRSRKSTKLRLWKKAVNSEKTPSRMSSPSSEGAIKVVADKKHRIGVSWVTNNESE